jgi:hypothetical protein
MQDIIGIEDELQIKRKREWPGMGTLSLPVLPYNALSPSYLPFSYRVEKIL